MKLKHLLQRVEDFLDADARQRRAERSEVKKVLSRLKKKEKDLKAKVAGAAGDERDSLESRLKVVHAQRRKGVAALKALKRK